MLGLFRKRNFENRFQIKIRKSDIFLVSVPRSGNTWLRFLLAKLLHDGNELDRHLLEQIVPDLYKSSFWIRKQQKNPRLIKTHEADFSLYPKSVYICRDGRDVLVSRYFYFFPEEKYRPSFSQFLRDNEFNQRPGWGEHVKSFLDFREKYRSRTFLVKFEDLLNTTEQILSQLAQFCSISTTKEKVSGAVKFCELDNLKKISELKGTPYPTRMGVEMFREGKVGGWRNFFSAEENQLFCEKHKTLLDSLGYKYDLLPS